MRSGHTCTYMYAITAAVLVTPPWPQLRKHPKRTTTLGPLGPHRRHLARSLNINHTNPHAHRATATTDGISPVPSRVCTTPSVKRLLAQRVPHTRVSHTPRTGDPQATHHSHKRWHHMHMEPRRQHGRVSKADRCACVGRTWPASGHMSRATERLFVDDSYRLVDTAVPP